MVSFPWGSGNLGVCFSRERIVNHFFRTLLPLLVSMALFLPGCGHKGNLYLKSEQPEKPAQEADSLHLPQQPPAQDSAHP